MTWARWDAFVVEGPDGFMPLMSAPEDASGMNARMVIGAILRRGLFISLSSSDGNFKRWIRR